MIKNIAFPNPLDLKPNQSATLRWESYPPAQIHEKYVVERVPFPSNAFYYTHNFWLNNRTLIFESPIDFITIGPYLVAHYAHLFKLEYQNDSKDLIITKLTDAPVRSMFSVLSNDKNYLYTHNEKRITRFNVNDFSKRQEIILDVPDHFMMNQLVLQPGDSKLLFELNLNWYKLDSEKKIPTDSSINYIDTANFDKLAKSKGNELVPPQCIYTIQYPYSLFHILCNPVNPNQISFAKCMYELYPKIKECNERLWLIDIEKADWRIQQKAHLLYHQKKKALSKAFEIVTHESWCSNGEYLTFISRRNKIKRVFIRDGTSEVLVEGSNSRGPHPWHCDGSDPRLIAFDTMNKNTGVWIKNLDTGELSNISKTMTNRNCQNFHPHPFFSPDKDFVFFNSDFEGTGHLYRIRTNI
jgi:hypothetical protein